MKLPFLLCSVLLGLAANGLGGISLAPAAEPSGIGDPRDFGA